MGRSRTIALSCVLGHFWYGDEPPNQVILQHSQGKFEGEELMKNVLASTSASQIFMLESRFPNVFSVEITRFPGLPLIRPES